EVDRRGALVVRACVGADDSLAQIGELHPLVLEITLHQLNHRPLEQEAKGLWVAAQSSLDLLSSGSGPDPKIAVALGAQGISQPALDRLHRPPALEIARREPLDLGLASPVVIPQLDAGPVFEGDEHAAGRWQPAKAVTRQVELRDDQGMEQTGDIGAG